MWIALGAGWPAGEPAWAQGKEILVWALPASKVYHCPGSRWYRVGKGGRTMPECQAIREGYRPAFGRGCGSGCKG